MAHSIQQRRVKDIMSRDVVTLDPEDKITEALELLVANRVSALPVVDKRKKCIGILSTSDLIDLPATRKMTTWMLRRVAGWWTSC